MQSIIIADSHTLCREALCSYLRQASPDRRFESVGDLNELISALRNNPDLVLIDTDFHGWKDAKLQGNIFCGREETKIGLIVPLLQTETKLGANISGVFPKSMPCKSFLSGIDDILSGKTFFPSLHDNAINTGYSHEYKKPLQEYNLTTREKEVLGHLVKGASNKDIARALDLQVVTVKLHVRGICRKMKASNRTQAALFAKENGWG